MAPDAQNSVKPGVFADEFRIQEVELDCHYLQHQKEKKETKKRKGERKQRGGLITYTLCHLLVEYTTHRGGELGSSTIFKNLMSPTPRHKWYLTTGRRAH